MGGAMAAINFLEYSRSYRRDTSPEIRQRREIIVTFLTDEYKIPRNKVSAILSRLRSHGYPGMKQHSVMSDVATIRTAYLFLTGNEETRRKIEEQVRRKIPTARGAYLLREDGIARWDEILKLAEEQPIAGAGGAGEPVATANDVIGEHAEDLLVLGHDDLLRVREALRKVLGDYEAVATENSQLKDELEKLRLRHAALEKTHDAMKQARLAEIATLYPEFPALFKLAEHIGEHERKKNGTTEPPPLPQTSPAHQNVPMTYHSHFIAKFDKSTRDEREQVVKALTLLTTQGASHNSLDTEPFIGKLPHVPQGCVVSRGSRELRIVWKKLPASIEVFALARHQDLYRSER
jgi:hypothetical protein